MLGNTMALSDILAKLIASEDLSETEMAFAMERVMTGQATPAQIGGLLVALRMKGETIEEITAAAKVMRKLATPVTVQASPIIDTCGTGGDGANLFNVSTASAFVVAAAGAHVAKHGNRSVSSSTGSADLLECAGVNVNMTPDKVARAIDSLGIGFMFAPAHHGAMKHAIGPRKELALRTIFNVLGPLTNPAGAKRQVIGVFDRSLCEPIARVLGRLGSERALVVHADDGLDEFSIAAQTYVAELADNGQVNCYSLAPEDVGIARQGLDGLSVTSAEQSLALIRAAYAGEKTDVAQRAAAMIALNAGAAIYVAGLARTIKDGVAMAQDALSTGAAAEKLQNLIEFSQL